MSYHFRQISNVIHHSHPRGEGNVDILMIPMWSSRYADSHVSVIHPQFKHGRPKLQSPHTLCNIFIAIMICGRSINFASLSTPPSSLTRSLLEVFNMIMINKHPPHDKSPNKKTPLTLFKRKLLKSNCFDVQGVFLMLY